MKRLFRPKTWLFTAIVIACIALLWRVSSLRQPSATVSPSASPGAVVDSDIPLKNADVRVTKKPFGIYVSPNDSPVSPERFSGYHTGLDFETTPQEQDIPIVVRALCDGILLLKKYATGYGGVAVQSCVLEGQPVTVIYGHLKIDSVSTQVGAAIKHGDTIGILGKGFSSETDGERKHLHLGMHKGTAVNILGYVQSRIDLSSWLDPALFI